MKNKKQITLDNLKEADIMIGDISGLAKKYNKSGHEVVIKIGEGEKVETERTENAKVARKIALDHIAKDWDYYTKIKNLCLDV